MNETVEVAFLWLPLPTASPSSYKTSVFQKCKTAGSLQLDYLPKDWTTGFQTKDLMYYIF